MAKSAKLKSEPRPVKGARTGMFKVLPPAVKPVRFTMAQARAAVRKLNKEMDAKQS